MIDSTEVDVLEASLKLAGGKCVINSINLEEFDEAAKYYEKFVGDPDGDVDARSEANKRLEVLRGVLERRDMPFHTQVESLAEEQPQRQPQERCEEQGGRELQWSV